MLQLLTILLLLSATALHAQHYGPELPGDPELAVSIEYGKFRQEVPDFARSRYPNIDFQGVLYESIFTRELYPVLPMVFFDSGSAEIPERYVLIDSAATWEFNQNRLPGGTLQKYRNILNIIGYRLRAHPHTSVEIAGYHSADAHIGESRAVAAQRAKHVYVYLRTVWGIEPSRITLLPAGDLPPNPSDTNDVLGDADNRRVEILSDDWEIVQPINQSESRKYIVDDTWIFHINNHRAEQAIRRRYVTVRRWDRLLATVDVGTANTVFRFDMDSDAAVWNFGWETTSPSILPTDTVPFELQLVVEDVDGNTWRSEVVELEVREMAEQKVGRRSGWSDREIYRYSLTLFEFASGELDRLQQRVVWETMGDEIRTFVDSAELQFDVIGYCDVIGPMDSTQAVSERRARAVAEVLQSSLELPDDVEWDISGVGETSPLYSNQTPEGRFYNRTVQVVASHKCRCHD